MRLAARLCDVSCPGDLARAQLALAGLLEAEVRVAPGPLGVAAEGALHDQLAPNLVAVALEHPSGRLAIELEPALALAVVDRVLGGEGTGPAAPVVLSEVEQGVLAFVAARTCVGSLCVVADVFGTAEGLAGWLGSGAHACWALSLTLGARGGSARIWAPERTLARLVPRSGDALRADLAELPVSIALRLGRASLPSRELEMLGVGDVLLPDELGCVPGPTGNPEPSELCLTSPRGGLIARLTRADDPERRAWQVDSLERGSTPSDALLLAGEPEKQRGVEAVMSETKEAVVVTGELSVVQDVPVEISIELGRIELRVGELAALMPGRVISARLPVAGPVELRAGGRVLAIGELVDIEGELGVRILERR